MDAGRHPLIELMTLSEVIGCEDTVGLHSQLQAAGKDCQHEVLIGFRHLPDPLRVQGNIQEIQGQDVIVESDGERWLMSVGESVAQALALPPEY